MKRMAMAAGICIGSAVGVLAAPPVTDGLKLMLDASDAGSLVVNGLGQVSEWGDLTGGGHPATQAETSMRPFYNPAGLAGRASLSFTGASVLATTSFMNYSNHTIFVVAQATATSENDFLSSGSIGTGNDVLLMNFQNIYRGHYWLSASDAGVIDSGAPSIWAPAIYEQTVDDVSMRTFRNGQLDGVADVSRPHSDALKPVCLGSRSLAGGANFRGEMSEVLVYDRALSDAERLLVNEYLAAKWLIKSEGAPPVTAGLRLWLDAGDESSLAVGAGGKVSQWKNLTGMERTAAQGAAEFQPTYNPTGLNGKAALTFNGANALVTPVFMNFSNHTVFVVAKAAAFGENDMLGSGGTGVGDILLMNFGGRYRGHHWTSAMTSADAWGAVLKPAIYEQTADDATFRLHMNGLLAATKAVPTNAYTQVTKPVCLSDRLGGAGSGRFVGEMSEVLIYDRALGEAERVQVEAYLTAKWSIGAQQAGAPPVTLGLQLWLDAANASSLVKDGDGKVSEWRDATGLGRHAVQAAVGSQPTYNPLGIKKHPSLTFNGAAFMATPEFMNFSNHTVMVVAKATVINAYKDILGSNGTGPGDVLLMNVVEGKYRRHYWHGSGIYVIDSAAPSVVTPVIYEQLLDDAVMKLFRSGQSDGSLPAADARPSTMRPVVLGSRFPWFTGDLFVGEMSEVLVYERALSDAERVQLEAYLIQKCLTPPPGTLILVM